MWRKSATCLLLAAILLLIAWGGCLAGGPSPTSSRTLAPAPPSRIPATYVPSTYAGSIDEVIRPEGPVASQFDDAEYRQLRRPDAIPPIYDPEFLSADETDLTGDELVIGLNINGDARAYPAGLLYHREMVNDTVGGVPVVVTWCPLC